MQRFQIEDKDSRKAKFSAKNSSVLTPIFYGLHKLWDFFHFFSQIEEIDQFQICPECNNSILEIKAIARPKFCKNFPVLTPISYECHKLSAFFLISFMKLEIMTNSKLLCNYCKNIVFLPELFRMQQLKTVGEKGSRKAKISSKILWC